VWCKIRKTKQRRRKKGKTARLKREAHLKLGGLANRANGGHRTEKEKTILRGTEGKKGLKKKFCQA